MPVALPKLLHANVLFDLPFVVMKSVDFVLILLLLSLQIKYRLCCVRQQFPLSREECLSDFQQTTPLQAEMIFYPRFLLCSAQCCRFRDPSLLLLPKFSELLL